MYVSLVPVRPGVWDATFESASVPETTIRVTIKRHSSSLELPNKAVNAELEKLALDTVLNVGHRETRRAA